MIESMLEPIALKLWQMCGFGKSMLPALCQHAQVPAEQRKAAETEAKRALEAEQEASHMISFFSVWFVDWCCMVFLL